MKNCESQAELKVAIMPLFAFEISPSPVGVYPNPARSLLT
ncbi:MAG: hypothetical protein ACI8UX_001240, partial [Psychromonas sp.]